MTLAAEAAPIADAAGPHVEPLMALVETRLGELSGGFGAHLAEHARATIVAGGKRLRPLLVIVAAGDVVRHETPLVRAAVAVELVHAATLVHDDVLDRADLRRGRPTVFAAAGRPAASATGDLLFARAFGELCASGDAAQVRALSAAGSALALGELAQRADAWRPDVGLDRYLHRCVLKTGRLFEAACTLGVLAGGGDEEAAAPLAAFGRDIGLAFQLLDDVLDVAGPVERTGKPRGTDLLDGTITLPYVIARERDPELAALDPRRVTTKEHAEQVCDAIAATGALDDARARAHELVGAAKAILPAGLPADQRRALDLVADGVVARYA